LPLTHLLLPTPLAVTTRHISQQQHVATMASHQHRIASTRSGASSKHGISSSNRENGLRGEMCKWHGIASNNHVKISKKKAASAEKLW